MAKENTLIYRAQTGDEGAFADLMRAYHAFVCTIVAGIVDNPHDAEEVVQDAFLNAYQGLRQLEDATKFKSWLAEITRNRARNWLRKQQGETVSLDDVSEEMLQTGDSPDERLARLEQRELIRRTMETLPQKDRDIARAFYLEGASYDELTNAHGLSYNAIALRLFRIKRKLSKQLRYLLTGIFVSPAMTLKKLYSGGLTIMKVGTVPKITVGTTALIGLIFIGYIGIRQLNAPTVTERVYLSPWEDGTTRPRNNSEGLAAQTDSTQDTEVRDNPPQIAKAESTSEMEPIGDFFGQSDEMDMAQFATEVEFEPEVDQDLFTNTSTLLDNKGQSAEDVMYAYAEAFRNSDSEAMRPLLTEEYMRSGHGDFGDGDGVSIETTRDDGSQVSIEEMPAEVLELTEIVAESIPEMQSQAKVASSEYVGDEFHFRLRMPAPEIPDFSDSETEIFIPSSYQLIKMRKENGTWRIYDSMYDYDSAMSEVPEIPH